jgi:perosamine synthetase
VLDRRFGIEKGELMSRLASEGIDSRPFFHPLSSLPAYRGTTSAEGAAQRCPVAYALSPHGINLPSALSLTEAQVGRVCECLRRILA